MSGRHVNNWDVHIRRNFHPVYTLGGGRYDSNPVAPMWVEINVEFDDNDAALDFERKVRELLEQT